MYYRGAKYSYGGQFSQSRDEIRALVKSVIMMPADLNPDYRNNELEITLYPLSNTRSNEAVGKVIDILNQTQTEYPEIQLTLFYKTATI